MKTTTYSFADVVLIVSHPAVGQFTFTGEGVGSCSISRSNDVTQHDLAADGSVMVSKILAKNGTLTINIQQTSEGHKFLKRWLAYITNAETNEWAQASAVLRNPSLGETINMQGVSPQKRADVSYQSAGQQVAWSLMCAEIDG